MTLSHESQKRREPNTREILSRISTSRIDVPFLHVVCFSRNVQSRILENVSSKMWNVCYVL